MMRDLFQTPPIQKTPTGFLPTIRTKTRKQENQWHPLTKRVLPLATGIISAFGLGHLAYQYFGTKEIAAPVTNVPTISPSPTSSPSFPLPPSSPIPSQNATIGIIPFVCICVGVLAIYVVIAYKVANLAIVRAQGTPLTKKPVFKTLKRISTLEFPKEEFSIKESKKFLADKKNELIDPNKRSFTQENFDEMTKIIFHLNSLTPEKSLDYQDYRELIQDLRACTIHLLNYSSSNIDLQLSRKMIENTYDVLIKIEKNLTLPKIDKNLALPIASRCVTSLRKDLQKTCQRIVQKAKQDLKIPFAICCGRYANFSSDCKACKIIAEEIWNECQTSNQLKMEYLTSCSETDSAFCQDKLLSQKESFQKPDLNESEQALVTTCLENLFPKDKQGVLIGNQAIIFAACQNLQQKNEQTRKFLLPIAAKIIPLYTSKEPNNPWKASQAQRELNNINFSLFRHEKKYKQMVNWLSVINDPTFYEITEESKSDHEKMIKILNDDEDIGWQNVASKFPNTSPEVTENNPPLLEG